MPGPWTAIAPDRLPELLASLIAERPSESGGVLRVLIDGPRCAHPDALAEALVDPLRARSRPVHRVRAADFQRDASLRFEHGREDADAYYSGWTDLAALRREVLLPLGPGGTGSYLPTLRDPATNRATRAALVPTQPHAILVIDGDLLLGAGLPVDLEIHLLQSPATRARRMGELHPEWLWTLPALQRYDSDVDPGQLADVVIRLDDPRHPAIRLNRPELA